MKFLNSPQEKTIYLNPKQLAFVKQPALRKVFLGGRGSGKSTVMGIEAFLRVRGLPRSKGFVLGLTYNQILTKFLPPMIDIWEQHCLNIDQHYVVGVRPPKDFKAPYQPPRKYENVISFFNGACIELISFDRKDASRGGNYDYGLFDEAVLLDKDRHDKEIVPAIRGNFKRFPAEFAHLHGSRVYVSSQAWTPKGEWIAELKNEMDNGKHLYHFVESTSWDNVAVLGEETIREWQRTLPYWTYQVEVMNQRLSAIPNSFYDELDEARHFYAEGFDYGNDDAGRVITTGTTDYDPARELHISLDFGSSICVATIHQDHQRFEGINLVNADCVIDQLFVKRDLSSVESRSLLVALVEKFAEAYPKHRGTLKVWGDYWGNNRQVNSNLTYFQEIEKLLRAKGYYTVVMANQPNPEHKLKHFIINRVLSEQEQGMPRVRFNKTKCKHLILSMQHAPLGHDFRKDKSSERNASLPQERATHLSDAFDYYLVGRYGYLFGGTGAAYTDPIGFM